MGIWTSARPGLSFWTRWSKVGFGWKGLLPPFSRARPWLHQQLCVFLSRFMRPMTLPYWSWQWKIWTDAVGYSCKPQCGLQTLWVTEVLSWGSWDQNYVYINNNTKMLFVFFTLGFSWVYMEFFRGYLMWDIRTDWMQKPAVLITRHERNLQKCKAVLLSYQIFLIWKVKLFFVKMLLMLTD